MYGRPKLTLHTQIVSASIASETWPSWWVSTVIAYALGLFVIFGVSVSRDITYKYFTKQYFDRWLLVIEQLLCVPECKHAYDPSGVYVTQFNEAYD